MWPITQVQYQISFSKVSDVGAVWIGGFQIRMPNVDNMSD